MRRISAKYAKSGMILGQPVYDAKGKMLFDSGVKLEDDHIKTFNVYSVGEVLIDDPRVMDVDVRSMIPPELEAQATHSLRQLEQESRSIREIPPMLLEEMKRPIFSMSKSFFPDIIGEPNAAGCLSLHEYNYIQPTKVAAMTMVIGKSLGYSMMKLAPLGLASQLMNIGYILLPDGILDKPGSLSAEEHAEIHKHPEYGAKLLKDTGRVGDDVVETVLQHHERWDGSGYPNGLKGKDISVPARLIAIADSYYALVSRRPHRQEMLPHEAIEFIMAFAGDLFDPDLAQMFARQVPIYPSGITVKLNTKEVGIVSSANIGQVGRPKIRIIYDEASQAVKTPYDLDLRDPDHRDKLVTEVLGY